MLRGCLKYSIVSKQRCPFLLQFVITLTPTQVPCLEALIVPSLRELHAAVPEPKLQDGRKEAAEELMCRTPLPFLGEKAG